MHNYKELKFWQKAMDIAEQVYELTKKLPDEEKYGLTSQLRRSSVSISSNIAEGAGRNSDKDFIKFLGIATGSSYELQSQILLSIRLGYLEEDHCAHLTKTIDEFHKTLYVYKNNLEKNLVKEPEAPYLMPEI